MTTETLMGPAYMHGTPVVSAPSDNGLAVAYNQALAEVLYLLDDQDLAALAVNLKQRKANRPTGTNPGGIDLALSKAESEAVRRWNLRKGGSRWLAHVLSDDLFLPEA